MKKNSSQKQNSGKSNPQREKEAFASYIGIDLGDKHCDVCVLDGQGEVHKEFCLRMKGPELQGYFASVGRSRVAVETGANRAEWRS